MASALASLHGQGMVHMDMKPDNIMIGDDGAYKLGDFGLAARIDGGGGSITEGDSRFGAGPYSLLDPARMQGIAARPDLLHCLCQLGSCNTESRISCTSPTAVIMHSLCHLCHGAA